MRSRARRETVPGRIALTQLRRACVEAKEELSSAVSAEIPVILPDETSSVRLTRSEFEAMIRPMLLQTIALMRQLLTRVNVRVDDLSAVLLIGGASRTPLVADLVRSELGVDVRIDAHPKLVVARGAARRSAAAETSVARVARSRRSRRIFAAVLCVILVALGAVAVRWWSERSGNEVAGENATPRSTTPTATTGVPTPKRSVTDIAFIGGDTIGSDVAVEQHTILGLSGIAYDSDHEIYYVISDQDTAPHAFRISIDLADGGFDRGDVGLIDAVPLTGADGAAFRPGEIEPEAIALTSDGGIAVVDEGDAALLRPASVREFTGTGELRKDLASPSWYQPVADGSSGIVAFGGFRALTVAEAPSNRMIVGASRPLAQDATDRAANELPFARLLAYDQATGMPVAEYGYPLDEPSASPDNPRSTSPTSAANAANADGDAPSTGSAAVAPAPDVSELEDLVRWMALERSWLSTASYRTTW